MIEFDMDYIIQMDLINQQEEREKKLLEEDQSIHFGFYPISKVGYCLRRNYLDIKDGNHFNLDAMRAMKLGEIVQTYTDGVLTRFYGEELIKIERTLTIPIQTPNQEEEWIFLTGRTDHKYTFKKKGNRRYYCPIEAKYMVDKLVDKVDKPTRDHKYQINSYILGMNAAHGFIYYLDHKLRAKTFPMMFDQELWTDTKDRVCTLHSYIKHDAPVKTVPAEGMFDKEISCWFCSHYKTCKQLEEKKK